VWLTDVKTTRITARSIRVRDKYNAIHSVLIDSIKSSLNKNTVVLIGRLGSGITSLAQKAIGNNAEYKYIDKTNNVEGLDHKDGVYIDITNIKDNSLCEYIDLIKKQNIPCILLAQSKKNIMPCILNKPNIQLFNIETYFKK